jgi:membrane peptidoglycan carboxypeptidase
LNTKCTLKDTPPPQKTTFYARDGKTVLATLFSQDRTPVPLSEVPPFLEQALVATEDRRFYSHHGVDMRGLLRSAVSTSGGNTEGGSTLTMQYVKQLRYYHDIGNKAAQQADISQNLARKMEDAQCAIAFEKHESKNQILDNYLNIAFFGENAYSVQTAAQTYFNTSVKDLTLPQAALLVGLLRAPSAYDPFVDRAAATARRNEVLQDMVAVHDLTPARARAAEATPIQLATTAPPVPAQGCAHASRVITNSGFFCSYAIHWLTTVAGISGSSLATGGYRIVTTLDPRLQNAMQRGLSRAMPATTAMTSVLPAIDPRTGDVLAMATNKRYGDATSAQDRTHTTLPVFTSYTAYGASTYKLFSLLTALETGVPMNWTIGAPGFAQHYQPSNCAGSDTPATNGDALEPYSANESLTSGTAKSSNTFFVAMDDQLFGCDLAPIVDLAAKLGMKGFDQPSGAGTATVGQDIVAQQRVLELALGSGIGTSPLELAGAYAAVANGGTFNAPSPIDSITDSDGRPVPLRRVGGVRVLAPQVAAEAIQVLQGDTIDTDGTSYQPFQNWYSRNTSVVAGKTGTAVSASGAENSALWFAGLTPRLVATSAVINPDAPSRAIPSLPGVADPGTHAYGDYASRLWLDALAPTLSATHWTWPTPGQSSGNTVPDVTGEPLGQAEQTLQASGYHVVQLDAQNHLECASASPLGSVAFFAPHTAVTGETINICPSSGIPQSRYAPPPPPIYVPPAPPQSPSPTRPGRAPKPAPTSSSPSPRPPSVTPTPSATPTSPRRATPTSG